MPKANATFVIDGSMHWTEHFVEYGFAVLRGLVDREFCAEALAEVGRVLPDARPPVEWTAENPGQKYTVFQPGENALLERMMFGQPRVAATIAELFGEPAGTELTRTYYSLWLNPYQASARPSFRPLGHIDSGDPYRGISFQISLIDTEPFSGNMTVFPESHKVLHRVLLDHPEQAGVGGSFVELLRPLAAYEFIAQAGDVLLVHHLAFHSGNPSHAEARTPRVALRAEAFRPAGMTGVDPVRRGASAFERSLGHHGAFSFAAAAAPVAG
jgi:hypothetical protein